MRFRSNKACVHCHNEHNTRCRHEVLGETPRFWQPIRVARRKAIERGDLTYEVKPCRHGHGTRRYTSSHDCVECAAIYEASPRRIERKRRARRRQYRKAMAAPRAVRA
jgi:hypothetical protein